MLWRYLKQYRYQLTFFLTLLFASAISALMVLMRIVYTGHLNFTFMWWNLFLAWLPLLLAVVAFWVQRRPWLWLLPAFFWLLFLPNAPYMITDLMHLSWQDHAPLWYDSIMLFSFAITGLLLGFTSLSLMHTQLNRMAGNVAGWLFVIGALSLSSFGVYIGRFLRWNSWDLLTNPRVLAWDLLHIFRYPQDNVRTFAVWLLLTAVFIFTYILLVSLPKAMLEQESRA